MSIEVAAGAVQEPSMDLPNRLDLLIQVSKSVNDWSRSMASDNGLGLFLLVFGGGERGNFQHLWYLIQT